MSDISTSKKASTASFLTALTFNAAVFAAEIFVFTILRPRFRSVYEPRTYVPAPPKRAEPLDSSWFSWPVALYKADYRKVIDYNGLDTYFFLRYLRMMVRILLPIWFISWAVLLPITSVNTQVGTNAGLDLFTFGNVENTKQKRYIAHIILVYLFTGWIYYNIKTEMAHFTITRQKHLISSAHVESVQARTLLVTGIPSKYLSEEALRKLFGGLPGGVNKIWVNRNLKQLPDYYERRMQACNKLEGGETKLLALATKAHAKALKKKGASKAPDTDVESDPSSLGALVPRSERPTHRLGFLGLFGEKVDTIDWAREEIRTCTKVLDAARKVLETQSGEDEARARKEGDSPEINLEEGAEQDEEPHSDGKEKPPAQSGGKEAPEKEMDLTDFPAVSSAFIMFNKQIAAHLAMQSLLHHEPYRMIARYTEVAPEDVIWANLGLNSYEIQIRTLIGYALTAVLIIFWAIPVGFIGIISNVYSLCQTYKWLAWICKLPKPILGIIAGILPPVLLVVLMMLLPIVLRLLARFEGIPKKTGLELSLMTRYFTFQVIHSFLIVSLASGLIAALPGLIKNPGSAPTLLAQNLPLASTFFLTYVVLQGLAGTAGGFLQAVALILYYVKLVLLGSTPRSVYNIKYGLRSVEWGTIFPGITLLTVVAFGYMILAPIVNGLACATFFAFYMMYKYLFLWQYGQPPSGDTGGLFFPKAIQHVFVGMYVQQVCLCALFFLARDQNKKASAFPEGILMVVLIIFTVLFNMMINDSYGPLLYALPLTLADKTYGGPAEHHDAGMASSAQAQAPAAIVAHDSTKEKQNASAISSAGPTPTAKIEETPYVAVPPGDQEQNPEAARQHREEQEFGFAHPAASRPQRCIWLPEDRLGLFKEEVKMNKEMGVDAEAMNAVMNEKGSVDISGPPPDEIQEE